VFILIARHLGSSISAFLESGGRKITQWYRQESHVEVEFGPDESLFANVNTPEDIVTAGKLLRAK
jgi:molybdopterin-guanine dinucleotide biosynthesis protein A